MINGADVTKLLYSRAVKKKKRGMLKMGEIEISLVRHLQKE